MRILKIHFIFGDELGINIYDQTTLAKDYAPKFDEALKRRSTVVLKFANGEVIINPNNITSIELTEELK